jgi:hypothetical protein
MTAVTLVRQGGLLQRVMYVGFKISMMALSEAGIELGEFPVVKHIGKRDETKVGMGMGFGSTSNFGARMPIRTPTLQTSKGIKHPAHKLLIVRSISLHAYTCLRTSLGPERQKSAFSYA